MDKKRIAEEKATQRSSLDKLIKKAFDQKIHAQILERMNNFSSVALFTSFDDEIETHSLIETLLKQDYKVFLPKVEGKQMNFYKIDSLNDLIKSSFGILEPAEGIAVSKKEIDVIVVPLLAYNDKNYRIGYGGGYYDDYLKDYKGLKLGIAYSFQKSNEDFVEDHDIACDLILTERGIA